MEATATAAPNIQISTNTQLAEILRIYDLQNKNLQNMKNKSISDRLKKIKELEKVVLENRTQIQDALYKDFRKAPLQTDFSETYPVVAESRLFNSNLHEWSEAHDVSTPITFIGSNAKIEFEPKGRILLLTPWNYPFQIPLKNLIAAYAAGNVVMIKPSEFTPHTSILVKEIVAKIFPENEVAVITGDMAVSQEILKLRYDHIHFTGSPAVGKIIMRIASENLTSVTLELGGKSPTIVDETANIKKAARNIIWSKYLNNGQTCVASDYVYVHASKKEEFVQQMREQIKKAFGENAQKDGAYCRMINSKHFARVKGLMHEAISKGAKVENGATVDASENYIAPTVLSNVNTDMALMKEEIFGPVLPVLTYTDINEVLRFINANEKPLALYIYSSSSKNQEFITHNTTSGAVCINESMIHNSFPGLPFGGVNNSGIGKSHGLYGFKEFSNEKAVLKAWNAPSDLLTPPYSKISQTLVDAMLKFL